MRRLIPFGYLVGILSTLPAVADETFTHEKISVAVASISPKSGSVSVSFDRTSKVHGFSIPSPDRIVLDVQELGIRGGTRFNPAALPDFVRRIRIGAHESTMTRIVIDLARPCIESFDLSPEQLVNGVTVRFELPPSEGAAPAKGTTCRFESGSSEPAVTPTPSAAPTASSTQPAPSPTTAIEKSAVLSPDIESSNVAVDTSVVYFDQSNRPIKDVVVKNTSDRTMLVESTIQELKDPESTEALEQKTKALLVSPKQLKLGPRESRTVRILLAEKATDRERYFRVTLSPIPTTGEDAVPSPSRTSALLSVLAISPPATPKEVITGRLEAKNFVIENSGNISLLLEDGEVCAHEGGAGCKKLPSRWLVAGSTWPLDATDAGSIRFLKKNGSAIQPLVFTIE